jgi:ArsR family transcriptional regulator
MSQLPHRRAGSIDPDVRLLQAVAEPTRLAIVRQLGGEGAVCACDFTACCDVSQPTVSHHLKVLREAGVVESERRGTWVYYRLTDEAVERLRGLFAGLAPRPANTASGFARPAAPSRSLPVIQ